MVVQSHNHYQSFEHKFKLTQTCERFQKLRLSPNHKRSDQTKKKIDNFCKEFYAQRLYDIINDIVPF